MNLTYYGHSCFAVSVNGKNILFDPFITGNKLAAGIDINEIPADYIFISHGHFDHILDAEVIARRTGATIVCGWEIYNWFLAKGISKAQPLNPGGKWDFGFATVKCVVAQHSNSLPDGSYGGAACGFAFYTAEGNFYYSGDTALTMDMKLILSAGKPDFMVLPIGDALTMGAEDAIELAGWLQVSHIVGVHYDTFPFIRIDHEHTIKKFEAAGQKLHLLNIGETISVPFAQ